jgi:hypothetical protein
MRLEATLIATISAAAIAVARYFGISLDPSALWLPISLLAIPVLILPFIIASLMMAPLQRAGAGLSPQVITLYRQDRSLAEAERVLRFMPVLFIVAALALVSLEGVLSFGIFLLWLICLGMTLDAFRTYVARGLHFLDPSAVVHLIADAPMESTDEVTHRLDILAEVALRSLNNGGTSMAQDAVGAMVRTMRNLLEDVRESNEPEERETASFALYHLLEQLEMLYLEAENLIYLPVCQTIITSLGKLAAITATYDLRMAVAPIQAIATLAHDSIEEEEPESAIKACCTIQEVARVILQESNQKAGFQELFHTIIHQLSEITKELFRNDKTTPVLSLMAPFTEIKHALQASSFADHPDSEVVTKALDDVIEQFSALAHVMTHKDGPKQPVIKEDEE